MTEERRKQLQEYMDLIDLIVDCYVEEFKDTMSKETLDQAYNAKIFALFAMKSMISSAKEGGVDECTMERF